MGLLRVLREVWGEPRGGVALHEPLLGEGEAAAVAECVRSGMVSSHGVRTTRFEQDLAAVTGAAEVVATVNGTAALHLALVGCGVRAGDEVLVPAFSFVATVNAVAYCGARPHFVDSEPVSMGVDPEALAAHLGAIARVEGASVNRVTGAPIRALVVMHAYGHPAATAELVRVAQRWGVMVLEDAAEALGSRVGCEHVGLAGAAGVLSFNGNKIITAGGGGAIITHDRELAGRVRHLGSTAKRGDRLRLDHDQVGWNYRMPNVNAALVSAQLTRLPDLLARKRALAGRYIDALAGSAGVAVVGEPPGTMSNYWLVVARAAGLSAQARDALLGLLIDAGYGCRAGWRLVSDMPMYAGTPRASLTTATALADTTVCLPSSPWSLGVS